MWFTWENILQLTSVDGRSDAWAWVVHVGAPWFMAGAWLVHVGASWCMLVQLGS